MTRKLRIVRSRGATGVGTIERPRRARAFVTILGPDAADIRDMMPVPIPGETDEEVRRREELFLALLNAVRRSET